MSESGWYPDPGGREGRERRWDADRQVWTKETRNISGAGKAAFGWVMTSIFILFVVAVVGAGITGAVIGIVHSTQHHNSGTSNTPPTSPDNLPVGLSDTTYDTASCADWLAADALTQQAAAIQYMDEFSDPHPIDDLDPLVSAVTSVCSSYGSDETPRDAAKVSINAVYGGK